MRITSAGNVGIGTTSPTIKLDVNSAGSDSVTRFQSTDLRARILIQDSADISYFGTYNGITFLGPDDTVSTNNLQITSAGNVGIGTTSPGAPLDVKSNSVSSADSGIRLIANGSSDVIAAIGEKSTNGARFHLYDGGTAKVSFYSDGTNNYINAGNVGIGTTSPAYKLHVNGGDAQIANGIAGTLYMNNSNNYLYGDTNGVGVLAAGNNLRIKTNNFTRLRVIQNGNVGIGTTSPEYKLEVNGGAQVGGLVTYSKNYSSLNTTGNAVAGLTTGFNGASAGFTFTCFGDTGGYQKIVYSCYNGGGTWYTSKVIDEGTNDFDIEASANGTTITFTFKSTSGTRNYTPRVTVQATGTSINSTYA
jgi:hypothetical protein